MKVNFYFDPSCPFCWVTSRWLLMVSGKRELEIDWRLFSLAIKNSELGGGDGRSKGFDHLPAHRVERVMLAASKQGAQLDEMYKTFGIKHFLAGDEYDDAVIVSALNQLKLNPDLIKAADDSSLDDELVTSTNEAVEIVGQDIGVPTIVFTMEDGSSSGFFGPVIQTLSDQDEAVEMWDSLINLVKHPYFFELKRGRTQGGPDVVSTAKC